MARIHRPKLYSKLNPNYMQIKQVGVANCFEHSFRRIIFLTLRQKFIAYTKMFKIFFNNNNSTIDQGLTRLG